MPHIFDVLHQDHERVALMLKQIENSADNEKDERASLVAIVRDELETHARFEEAEVYPAIQKALGEEEDLRHAVTEHSEALTILSALEDTATNGGEWKQYVKELEAAIQHHVDEEEHELFPQARDKLPETQAEHLSSSYENFKQEAQI
ncbi:MAG: hemerythrin domain-containing protein [Rhodospirillales bacterium]|nr:hemerythrin domain-containing protein [Rhodospirillales bacterium]